MCLNTSLTSTIRAYMFNHNTFIPSLMNISKNEADVVKQKALSVLRNFANHEDTKTLMLDFPGIIDTLTSVVKFPLNTDTDTKLAREVRLR